MLRRLISVLLVSFLLCSSAFAQGDELSMSGKKAAQRYDEAAAEIGGHPEAGRVVFDDYPIPPAILEKLKQAFPNVEFEYSVSLGGKRYRSTAQKASIRSTPVAGQKQFDALYKTLSHLPRLEELTALTSSFSFDNLEALRKLLPDMHVSGNILIGKRRLRTDYTAFSTRHAYYSTRYASDDFRGLKYCDNLLALDIGHNAVTDLDFLYDLPGLRVLILADNQITDLTPIASLHDLEYLEIFKNPVSDLSPLAGLKNLIDLNMTFCQVEDYTPLLGLKNLDRLWISENPYDEEDLQMLREALPRCTVNTDAGEIAPTANGWRQGHPRYLQIVKIFQTGRYKEFQKK